MFWPREMDLCRVQLANSLVKFYCPAVFSKTTNNA